MESGKMRLRGAAFILIFIGISLAMWGGWSDLKLWWYSEAEPQTITAQELAANGPGNNLHVLVTDYRTSGEGYGNSKVGYFLVFPAGPNTPDRRDNASLVLQTSGGDSIFGSYVPDDGLLGVVRNESNGFGSDQRTYLKKLGPINFEKVWVIDHLRKPPAWWSFLLKVLGGLGLVVAGGALFWSLGTDD